MKNFNFITHKIETSQGSAIFLMGKDGKSFARLDWYNDDKNIAYLSCLSVSEECRKQGIGTKLQEIREEMAIELGATTSVLSVEIGSWMHDWYRRRGYEDYAIDENENNHIWMEKKLVNLK